MSDDVRQAAERRQAHKDGLCAGPYWVCTEPDGTHGWDRDKIIADAFTLADAYLDMASRPVPDAVREVVREAVLCGTSIGPKFSQRYSPEEWLSMIDGQVDAITRRLTGVAPFLAAGRGDDETAIDETWLRAMGCPQMDSIAQQYVIGSISDRFEIDYFPKDQSLRLYASNLNSDGVTTSAGGMHIVSRNPTRGQLRTLAAALGIPLKDAP